MALTHVSELALKSHWIVVTRDLLVVHAEDARDEAQWELLCSISLDLTARSNERVLTKMIVITVKMMMARPCLIVSSACLVDCQVWKTEACCCLRLRRWSSYKCPISAANSLRAITESSWDLHLLTYSPRSSSGPRARRSGRQHHSTTRRPC